MTSTWICVAGGARAQFYHCGGPGREIEPSLGYEISGPASLHSVGLAAIDEDWPEVEKQRYAGRIAKQLSHAAARHSFQRLILVAPPAMMAELRRQLDELARGLVVIEVVKDLTRATPREMHRHLSEALPH